MRYIHPIPAAAKASALLGLGFLALGLLAGCAGDGPTAPERTWEEVRYHWSTGQTGASYGDLVVHSSGEMVWDLQGERAPSRGLLAGGNLETLTRLIDALPPAGYHGLHDCERAFFVTVTIDGAQRSYSAGSCDGTTPAPLNSLVSNLDALVVEATSHRTTIVPLRVLASGRNSRVGVEGRRVVSDRDQLLSMIEMLGSDRPAVMGAVDFRRDIVIGVFLGERATAGYSVEVASAYRTETGKLVLVENWIEPGVDCRLAQQTTRPFALVAIGATPGEGFVSEVVHTIRDCGVGTP